MEGELSRLEGLREHSLLDIPFVFAQFLSKFAASSGRSATTPQQHAVWAQSQVAKWVPKTQQRARLTQRLVNTQRSWEAFRATWELECEFPTKLLFACWIYAPHITYAVPTTRDSAVHAPHTRNTAFRCQIQLRWRST